MLTACSDRSSRAASAASGLTVDPRLVGVGYRAVANTGRRSFRRIVRVVGRLVRERQNFARVRIQHHQRTRFGVVVFDGRLQFAIGRKLQPEIETDGDVTAEIRVLEKPQFLSTVRRLLSSNTCLLPAVPLSRVSNVYSMPS